MISTKDPQGGFGRLPHTLFALSLDRFVFWAHATVPFTVEYSPYLSGFPTWHSSACVVYVTGSRLSSLPYAVSTGYCRQGRGR